MEKRYQGRHLQAINAWFHLLQNFYLGIFCHTPYYMKLNQRNIIFKCNFYHLMERCCTPTDAHVCDVSVFVGIRTWVTQFAC